MTTTIITAKPTVPKDNKPRYSVKAPSRGGARPGAGRPKGSTALITAKTLIEAIEAESGKPFEQMLAEGYVDAVTNNDNKMRLEYERMILGKVVGDKQQIETVESEDATIAKAAAFAEALKNLGSKG